MNQESAASDDAAWISVPEELATELDSYADLCHALVLAWFETARGLAEGAATGSAALADAREIRVAKPDAPSNVEHGPGQQAGLYVDLIGQHLSAIEDLLRSRRVAVSLWPLVRAAVETAGRAAWLLDPRVPPEESYRRVARLYLEMISALQRERLTKDKFDSRAAKQAKALCNGKKAEAQSLFGTDGVVLDWSAPDRIDEWSIGGEVMAGLGPAVASFTDLFFGGKASGPYDTLSDYSHPSLLTMAKLSVAVDVDGVTFRPWTIDRSQLAWQVRLACLTFYKACHLVASYYAIDDSPLERWAGSAPPAWFQPDHVDGDLQ